MAAKWIIHSRACFLPTREIKNKTYASLCCPLNKNIGKAFGWNRDEKNVIGFDNWLNQAEYFRIVNSFLHCMYAGLSIFQKLHALITFDSDNQQAAVFDTVRWLENIEEPGSKLVSVTSPLCSMNKYIDIIISQNTTQFHAQYAQYISQLHVSAHFRPKMGRNM